MRRFSINKVAKRRSKKHGLPPGALVHIGEKKAEIVKISILDYDESQFQEKTVKNVEECFPFKDKPTVTWINVDGLHQVEIIEKIGNYFGLHPLIMEDILNTDQRPKVEDFGSYLYIVLKMLYHDERDNETKAEQVSVILGERFVISFQEKEGDIFNSVRERIRNGKGRIRRQSSDYLAYALLDAVVDNYFIILEKHGEKVEELEDRVVTDPRPETLQEIHKLKREMIVLRRSVWPLRELISGLERGESLLFQKPTRIYLRDIYDHTIQVIDAVETFRDLLSGMHDTYLSSISNRMNEIMKVLTIIATIFIPLTFIAGVYGMNFEFMPELKWRAGYFLIWAVYAGIAVLMIFYFKKRKWL